MALEGSRERGRGEIEQIEGGREPMAKNRDSEDLTQQIDRLFQRVVQLYQQGRYQEAIALATQARDLACQQLGQDHPAYATSLNNLAMLYQAMGDHAAALPLFARPWRSAARRWARTTRTTPPA